MRELEAVDRDVRLVAKVLESQIYFRYSGSAEQLARKIVETLLDSDGAPA